MDDAVVRALERDRTVDITTIGRRSGEPRRIEIWIHHLEGRHYITGIPGRRAWYANLLADPRLTLHLKESAQADLRADARPVTEAAERRAVLEPVLASIGRAAQIDAWLDAAPLVEVQLDGAAG